MGYLKIPNLYADQRVLAFRQVYALEKVHGTSAHVRYAQRELRFQAGGASHDAFVALFDAVTLAERFLALGHPEVTVYGEAYGGKLQRMSSTYGPFAFVVFEVKIGESWLAVPDAEEVTNRLGLRFVPYELVSSDLESVNRERDRPSRVGAWAGIEGKPAEGVVLRPPFEVVANDGKRIMAKHKRDEFRETATPREVDPSQAVVLSEAQAIADEWVTPMRLAHVLDAMASAGAPATGPADIPRVIAAMVSDVEAEAAGEIEMSKAAAKAMGTRAAKLYQAHLKGAL